MLTKVRVRNQTDIPLFLQDISMTIKSPDGSDQENIAANDKDVDRVFQAYPSLNYLKTDSIKRDITLNPGQAIEGLEVFNFPISKEQWDTLQTAKVRGQLHAPEKSGDSCGPLTLLIFGKGRPTEGYGFKSVPFCWF